MIDNVLRSPRAPTSRLPKVKNPFKSKNHEYEIQPTYRARVGIGQDAKKQKIKNQQKVIQTTANHRSTFAAPDRKDFGQIATSKSPEVRVMKLPQTQGHQSQPNIKRHTKFKRQPVHMRARRTVQHVMEGMSEQMKKAKYYGWGKCKDVLNTYTLNWLEQSHYQSDSERKPGSTELAVVFLKSVSDVNIEQCVDVNKVSVSSQCVQTERSKHALTDQTEQADWIPIKEEIVDKCTETAETPRLQPGLELNKCPSNFRISETPRFRVLVKKFSKLQKDNIELRRLEEKVVCIEYDVFDLTKEADSAPVQCLRAFFSLKPLNDNKDKETLPIITNTMKDEDLNKLDVKEIEIIDGATQHNKSYIEDLNKILKLKKPITTKEGQPLNTDFIYEMAIKERMVVESDYAEVLLNKSELDNVKKIILANCPSTIHGFNRKVLKERHTKEFDLGASVISHSIINELMKQLD